MAAYSVCFPLFKISALNSNPKGMLGDLWFRSSGNERFLSNHIESLTACNLHRPRERRILCHNRLAYALQPL